MCTFRMMHEHLNMHVHITRVRSPTQLESLSQYPSTRGRAAQAPALPCVLLLLELIPSAASGAIWMSLLDPSSSRAVSEDRELYGILL